jgi:hypothetical protein
LQIRAEIRQMREKEKHYEVEELAGGWLVADGLRHAPNRQIGTQ